jgi:hypothetical protein
MKKLMLVAAALVAAPMMDVRAQTMFSPQPSSAGFYVGAKAA